MLKMADRSVKPLRICRDCGLIASNDSELELFKEHKKSNHGRENQCKKCAIEYQRKYRSPDYETKKKYYEDHPEMRPPLRVCRNCGLKTSTEDDLELFKKNEKSKYGRENRCNKCLNEYEKKRYAAHPEKQIENQRRYRQAHPFKLMLKSSKERAERYKLPFDLTLGYLKKIFDDCGGMCPMTGFTMKKNSTQNDNYSMSLDRIIPEKGYTQKNVRIVSRWYNSAKGTNSDDFTLEMCRRVAEMGVSH